MTQTGRPAALPNFLAAAAAWMMATAAAQPAAPASVTCVGGDYTVELSWTADPSATSFLVGDTATTATTLTVAVEENFQPQTWSVVAVDNGGLRSAAANCTAAGAAPTSTVELTAEQWWAGDPFRWGLSVLNGEPLRVDFDGDGDNDLIVSPYWCFKNESNKLEEVFGDECMIPAWQGAAVGDFTGDGRDDLARCWNGQVFEFTTGSVTSTLSVTVTDSATTPYTCDAADMDGDGDIDLCVGYYNTGAPRCLEQTSLGVFEQTWANVALSYTPLWVYVSAADCDQDGLLDLVMASESTWDFLCLKNLGSATVPVFDDSAPTGVHLPDQALGISYPPPDCWDTDSGVRCVQGARSSLPFTYRRITPAGVLETLDATEYWNRAKARRLDQCDNPRPAVFSVNDDNLALLTVADDGYVDVFVFPDDGGRPVQDLDDAVAVPVALAAGDAVAVGDLDGDGDDEWVVGSAAGAVAVDGVTLVTGLGANAYPALGDVDGDGAVDIVVGVDGALWVLPGATNSAMAVQGVSGLDTPTRPALVDVDLDGQLEILVCGFDEGGRTLRLADASSWLFEEDTGSSFDAVALGSLPSAVGGLRGYTNGVVQMNEGSTVGLYSDALVAVVSHPSVPRAVEATGGATVVVTWDLPAILGGVLAANVSYEVRSNGSVTTTTVAGQQRVELGEADGLVSGVPLLFNVTAVNAFGRSRAAAAAGAATPDFTPVAVANLSCEAGDYEIFVHWDSPEREFLVDGQSVGAATNATLRGLPNDILVEVEVLAANSWGRGAPATCSATPAAPLVALSRDASEAWGWSAPRTWGEADLAPAFGDVDGDGRVDLVVATQSSGVLYFRNDSDGRLVEHDPLPLPLLGRRVALGDVTGDGVVDAVLDGPVLCPGPSMATCSDIVGGGGSGGPALADMDGDGELDLVTSGHVSRGFGNGSFAPWRDNSTEFDGAVAVIAGAIVVGEDLGLCAGAAPACWSPHECVVGCADGSLLSFAVPGWTPTDLEAALWHWTPRVFGARNVSLEVADVNGDGLTDLLALSPAAGLEVFLSDGSRWAQDTNAAIGGDIANATRLAAWNDSALYWTDLESDIWARYDWEAPDVLVTGLPLPEVVTRELSDGDVAVLDVGAVYGSRGTLEADDGQVLAEFAPAGAPVALPDGRSALLGLDALVTFATHPGTPPSAPVAVRFDQEAGTLNVSWAPAAGADWYVVEPWGASSNESWVVLGGVQVGDSLTLEVIAANDAGVSAASPAATIDVELPEVSPRCTAGDYAAVVSWATEELDYVLVNGSRWANGSAWEGLDNWVPVRFAVEAGSDVFGVGPAVFCDVVPRPPVVVSPSSSSSDGFGACPRPAAYVGDGLLLAADGNVYNASGAVVDSGWFDAAEFDWPAAGGGGDLVLVRNVSSGSLVDLATGAVVLEAAGDYPAAVGDYDGDGFTDIVLSVAGDVVAFLGPAFNVSVVLLEGEDGEPELCDDGTLFVGRTLVAGASRTELESLWGNSSLVCLSSGAVVVDDGQVFEFGWHPDAPTGVVVESANATTVTVSWTPAARATSYRVHSTTEVEQTVATVRAAYFADLDVGVTAINAYGESRRSEGLALGWVRLTAVEPQPDGTLLVEWDAVDALYELEDAVVTPDGPLPCQALTVSVSFGDLASDTWPDAVVPHGVCPRVCSAGNADFIDPTGADPFAVVCDGNWTSTVGLSDERLAAVLALSTDVTDDAARTVTLQTNITATPPAVAPEPANLTADFAFAVSPPGAHVEVWFGGDGGWQPLNASMEMAGGTLQARAALAGDWWPADPTPATYTWLFDGDAPSLSFASRPSEYSASLTASFGLAADDATAVALECCVGGVCALESSAPPSANASAPETAIVGQAGTVFSLSSSGSLEYSVDGGASWLTSASADTVDFAGLDDGWYAVLFRSKDSAGVVDPSPAASAVLVGSVSEEVDTELVTVALFEDTANFSLSGGSAYEYALDGGGWTSSSSGQVDLADLAVGVHVVRLRAVGDPIPETYSWNVLPLAAPDSWFTSGPDAVVTASTAELAFACADTRGCQFEVSLDLGATWNATAGDSFVLAGLEVGQTYTAAVRTVYKGVVEESPALRTWTVVEPPIAETLVAPAALSTSSVAVFVVGVTGGGGCSVAWSVGDLFGDGDSSSSAIVTDALAYGEYEWTADVTCEVPAAAPLTFAWEVVAEADGELEVAFELAGEGAYEAVLTGVDEAGNAAVVAYNFTVDVTPPVVGVESWSVAGGAFNLSVACDDALPCELSVSVDGGPTFDVVGGDVSVTGLLDGAHNVSITSRDLAGNAAADEIVLAFVVDNTPPVVWWVGCEDAVDGECAELEWRVAGGEWRALPVATDLLGDGLFELELRGSDSQGNAATVSSSVLVDTTPPLVAVEQTPAAVVSANVSLGAVWCFDLLSACTVNVSGRAWENGSVPVLSLLLSEDGWYEVVATPVDAAGNVGEPWVAEFELDTTRPEVAVLGVEYLGGGRGNVSVVCSEAACTVSSPSPWLDGFVFQGEEDGEETVCFHAVDQAGNWAAEAACVTLLLDATPPEVEIVLGDAVGVVATDANAVVECACSPTACDEAVDKEALDGQTLAVAVSCTDECGNVGSASTAWTIDVSPPVLSVAWGSSVVGQLAWTLNVSVEDTSSYSLACTPGACTDDGEWAVSVSGEGDWLLVVTATDAGGLVSEASQTVTVDTTAPAVEFSDGPAEATVLTDVTFAFACVSGAGSCGGEVDVDCSVLGYSLDGGAVVPLAADATELALSVPGEESHTLEVLVVDAAGNAGSGTYRWSVLETIEAPTILSAPPAASAWAHASFSWWVATGNAFEYRLDDGDWQLTYLTNVTLARVELGEHKFSVRLVGGEQADVTWEYGQCKAVGELQYEAYGNGTLVCVACRATDGTDCALEGRVAEGFWAPANSTYEAFPAPYRCPVEFACPGAAACQRDGGCSTDLCREGHTGVLCAECSDGYGLTLERFCHECGEKSAPWLSGLLGALFVAGLLCAAGFIVYRSLHVSQTSRTVATLKIMANYFLMMSILKDMDLDWGALLKRVFAWVGVAAGGGVSDVQLVNCAFPVSVYTEFAVYMLVPVALLLGPGVGIVGAASVARLRLWRAGAAQPKNVLLWGVKASFLYRQCLLVLSYFAYPVVLTNAFRVLHCDEVDGRSYLVSDYGEACDGPKYEFFFAWAVFFVAVLGPGVPLAIGAYMRRYRDQLDNKHAKTERQFHFFYAEFRHEWYFWEVTVMSRKVLMGAIAVLLSNNEQNMQVYAGTWLLLVCFVAQLLCTPHENKVVAYLEIAALGAVTASLLLGQALAFDNLSDELVQFFRTAVLVLNLAVMNGMGLTLGHGILQEVRRSKRTLTLSRGLSGRFTGKAQEVEMAPPRHRAAFASQHFVMENPLVGMGGTTVS